MSKSLFALAVVATLLLFTSAYYTTPADGRVGYQAPELTLEHNGRTISLNQLRGRPVVVTFWMSAQPESRIDNITLERAAQRQGIAHLSVNLDHSQALFEQLARIDNLTGALQCHCDIEAQENVCRIWRQTDECCSFLIDSNGQIIAKDPSPDRIARLVAHSR